MPDRYEARGFTREQAEFLAAEADRLAEHQRELWRRTLVICGILILGMLFASAYGVHVSRGKADKGQLTALQKQQISDAANLSRDNCRRSQNGRKALVVILDAFGAPRHSPSYTPEQQARVSAAYAKIDHFHALDIPVCPGDKPKKGQ